MSSGLNSLRESWDAVSCIALLNLGCGNSLTRPVTGFPLAAAYLAMLLYLDWLPDSIKTHRLEWSSIASFFNLCVVVDGLQYVSHRMAHVMWRVSHGVHHTHATPVPQVAFHTGVTDAVLQLLGPILAATWIVHPSRDAFICFGGFYSLWLQWIHSDAQTSRVPRLLVTPRYHTLHHTHPNANYGHIFTLWDVVCGTCASESK